MSFIPNEGDAPLDGEQSELDSVDVTIILDGFRLRGVKSGCAVTASSPAAMTAEVAAGVISFDDGTSISVAGGTVTFAASATNMRFDLVVADSAGALSVVDGSAFYTATYGPALPTYTDKVVLAAVCIPANATSVTASNILDKRVMLNFPASSLFDHGGLGGLADDDHSQYHNDARALTWLGTRSTSDLPEGSNLYYTAERVMDVVGALIVNSTTIGVTYNDAGDSLSLAVIALTGLDTDDLAEGVTNLYFTNERAQDAVGGILTDTASINFTYDDAGNLITADVLPAGVDHGGLGGLADDDHSQYLLLAGRSGGQTAYGGTGAGDDLTLLSTSNITKGSIFLGAQSAVLGFLYDEANDRGSLGGGAIQHTVSGVTRNSKFEVHSEGGSDPMGFVVHRHSNNDAMVGLYSTFRSRGTHAAPTVVAAGDHVGMLNGYGYDGTDYEPLAGIHFEVDGTPGNNDMPGRITFYATADGAAALTEQMRLSQDGAVWMNNYLRVGALSAPSNTTAGDLTLTRIMVGANSAFGSAGNVGGFAHFAGTATATASGAAGGTGMAAVNTITPASNSLSEFRALYFENIINPSTGITLNIIEGGYFENRFRQDGAVTETSALVSIAVMIDSSSAATVGTISIARAFEPRIYSRPSGTSVISITTAYGIEFGSRFVQSVGATIGTLTNIFVGNPTVSTITTHVGLDISKLKRASTNIEFRNAGKMVHTPTAQTLAAAGNTIGSASYLVDIDNSTGASLTMTSTPTITDGVADGQMLLLTNVDSADNIVLQDESAAAGTKLRLPGAANVTLGPRDSILLRWKASASEWYAVAQANL